MHQLSTLPDVCLLEIFDRLDLIEQHQFGRVCRRLRRLQLSVDTQRKTLEISTKKNFRVENSISFSEIPPQLCQQVVKRFPNVVDLHILNWENSFEIDWNVNLLKHEWASKLVSLNVYSNYKENYLNVIKSINSLYSLKNLSLMDNFSENQSNQVDKLSILPKLSNFSFKTMYHSKEFLELLLQNTNSIISSGQLKSVEIEIDSFEWTQNSFQPFMNLSSEITHKFITFSPIPDFLDEDDSELTRFCSQFCSLKSIDIFCADDRSALAQKLKCLAPLFQLSKLELYLTDETTEDNSETVEIVKFPSVTFLRLRYLSNKPVLDNLIDISTSFPNVGSILIYFNDLAACPVCQQPFQTEDVSDEQKNSCVLHMIEPLKKCAKLNSIQAHYDLCFMFTRLLIAHLKRPFKVVKIEYIQ